MSPHAIGMVIKNLWFFSKLKFSVSVLFLTAEWLAEEYDMTFQRIHSYHHIYGNVKQNKIEQK